MKKKLQFLAVASFISLAGISQTVSDFESLSLTTDSFWEGTKASGDTIFMDGDASFSNSFDTAWSYWSGGWAYSNVVDTTTVGSSNGKAAFTGIGYGGSSNYAVGKSNSKVILTGSALNKPVAGVQITNSTYAALSMVNGDQFAKKFGGATGNDDDWFLLTIKGYTNGQLTSDSVNFYLADFRFTDNTKDYIVKTWNWVDLTSLGSVDSIKFNLTSSDKSAWGINTPAFFCMDDFNATGVASGKIKSKTIAELEVYPNPSTGFVSVKTYSLAGATLTTLDMSGRVVMAKIINSEVTSLDLSRFNPGVYFVKIVSNGKVYQQKLVKK